MHIRRRDVLKRAAVAGAACTMFGRSDSAKDNSTLDIGPESQHLIDDWIVERTDGLTRTLHHLISRS